MDSQCTSLVSLQKRKIIFKQKCPFDNGTSEQHTDNHSLLRLIVWEGQHPFIAIPEEFCFTITTVLLENLNVTQPVKKYLAPSWNLKANCRSVGLGERGGGRKKDAMKYFLINDKGKKKYNKCYVFLCSYCAY